MPRLRLIENWLLVLPELEGQSARAAAIVAGAFVENNLAVAILSRLRLLNGDQEDDLFGSEKAPFSTFHEKIEIGFALHLYSTDARHDLKIVKYVRNRFAHYLQIRDFSNPKIADKCAELKYPIWYANARVQPETTDPRERFMETVHHFIDGFGLMANQPQRPAASTVITY